MSALFPNYARRAVQLVKGKGTIVTDNTGKEYLDFTSGIAVLSLGHAHPALVETIQQQSQKLWHTSNLFESPGQEYLAGKLIEGTHFSHAFFCNSGTEANEAAIKLARKHTGKYVIITFEKSFHGRTFGSMSATGQDKVRNGFGPLLETFRTVPFNDVEKLKAVIDDEVGAIMLEVIQGEGGVNKVTPEFVAAINEICEEKGILLIIDEVQTGIGRTGSRYAHEQVGLKPDIMSLAKGLGGGFPIGALLGTAAVGPTFGPGSHGTTFGGNPLAVAVATTVVDHVFKEEFLANVNEISAYFVGKLKEALPNHPIVGLGLMIGIVCDGEAAPFITAAEKAGLLLVAAGPNVIRVLPPLTVTKDEIDQATTILAEVLNTVPSL